MSHSSSHADPSPSIPALAWDDCFHQLVDAIVDYAIFMLDTTGRVATWNSGAERLKGYRREEIKGKHFSVFYTPEDQAEGRPERILEIVRKTGRYEESGWRVRKDGARFWANVVMTALRDDRGTLLGFAKVTRDLSEKREGEENQRRLLREQAAREAAERGERQLQESEARFRAISRRLQTILEGIADGVTAQDRSGKIVFANEAAARICGVSTDAQLLALPAHDLLGRFDTRDEQGNPIPPEAFPGRRVLRGEDPGPLLMQVREKSTGRQLWMVVKACPVLGEDGTPELAVNIMHDVTPQHREREQQQYLSEATAALGRSLVSSEMLSALAGVLVPGMADWCSVYLLEDGHLRNVAAAHADEGEKMTLAKAYRAAHPPDPDRAEGLWRVLRTGTSEVFNDITDEMLSSSTTDLVALAQLRMLGIRGVLVAPVKVRERLLGVIALVSAETRVRYDRNDIALIEELGRRAGVALENAQLYKSAQTCATRAEQLARTAEHAAMIAEEASRAKDEFLATVSHELRTPLNAILGWSTLLKERVVDTAMAKPIGVIHRNAQAQLKIVDDILDVSRVITGKFRLELRPVDLVAIAAEAIEVVRPSATAKNLTMLFAPCADTCRLVADPERLQQAVWNVLSNAVKFTEAGGAIHVRIQQDGPTVSLSVADTGKGIEPAFLSHVFEQFRQADSSTTRQVGGLGLGLALVRHIVELHGGRATAASEGVGKGSTFTITLPVRAVVPVTCDPPSTAPVRLVASQDPALLRGVRVLVVDDEIDARDLISMVLVEHGGEVESARSALDGFEAFKRFRPHVLVSDIGLPDEDGYALIRRIRSLPKAEGGKVPSLALTAFAREDDRTRALSAGFTTHIGKPVNPDALASAVANLSAFTAR